MEEKGRDWRDDAKNKGAGVRVPGPGESSSSGLPLASDSPTIIDVPTRKLPELPVKRFSADMPTAIGGLVTPRPISGPTNTYVGAPILETGSILGGRYEVLQILGIGGMGAVYQAKDLELGRTVALKVIRPDLAGNQSILDRFKQELLLATQVTHKNVVRIYDLGESEGMKFITMEFVEGQDLRSLIHEKTKVSPEEAVEIMQQACRALEAAHAVGVIHRDLKPQNIMLDIHGRVVVMDFGLARTLGGDGMTQSGALVGTMEYMSPEQALAQELDQRSDIFSLGVIFYELLSGAVPFRADSALASLIKRTQERVVPVSELDATIPASLSAIVTRCLERDLSVRYQSAAEVLADLEAWQAHLPISPSPATTQGLPEKKFTPSKGWMIAACVIALVVATLGAALYFKRPPATADHATAAVPTAVTIPALTMAVLPLHNASGDSKLDWLSVYLAESISSDIGQSAQLRALPGDRVRQVLADLQVLPGGTIDADTLRHIVGLVHSEITVFGQYARVGEQIQIDVTVQDSKRDRTTSFHAVAANEQAIPSAVTSLADHIRQSLNFSSTQLNQLKAQSLEVTSPSVEALRAYNEGVNFMRQGRFIDAALSFKTATAADSQLALAFSALGQSEYALGHQADAEQSSRRAAELASTGGLPQIQKMLIDANRAAILSDNKKAISLYESLAQAMPGNVDVQYALGSLYSDTGAYDKARAIFDAMLDADPKNVLALWRSGAVDLQSGHYQAALEPLSRAEYLTNSSGNREQHAVILLAMGIAYQFLGKGEEGLRYFADSIAISQKLGQKRAIAVALGDTAQLQMSMGKPDAALENLKKAVALFQEIGSTKEAGDTLIDMASLYQSRGADEQALKLYREALQIERDAGDQNREALCLNNIAYLNLGRGDTESAFTYFQQALQLGEKIHAPQRIADPLQGLGEAYTRTGQYDEGLAALKRALDTWRADGNAIGVAATQRQMGLIFGYQARFGAAVDSIQQSVKGFQALGDKSSASAAALQGLAEALARAGRGEEAGPYLDQAEVLARSLKDEALTAEIFATRGDIALFKGDAAAADSFFQRAMQSAVRSGNKDLLAEAKLNLARAAIAQGRGSDAVARLKPLVGLDSSPDRNIALHSSVSLGEALILTKDYSRARQILQDAAAPTERAGMRLRLARIYYLQATASRLSGNPAAAWNEYRQALTLLNNVRNEPGAENILRRVDLKTIFDDCNRWVGAGKDK